jgi:hypothetical protein
MLIRYVDGPWKGDTVETTASTVHGVHTHDPDEEGVIFHEAVSYRVDQEARTAHLLAPADLKLVRDATVDELLAAARAKGWQERIAWLPMRRRRAPMPRAGFGQRWPSE